jgi:hypothetical protein
MKYWRRILPVLFVLTTVSRTPALPVFEPFTNAANCGGTSYANGAPLARQTNSPGAAWAQWIGGNNAFAVICTNAGLSYSAFPADFPVPPDTSVYIPGQSDLAGGAAGLGAALGLSPSVKADPGTLATNTVPFC